MAPCNGTQQWHRVRSPKVGRRPPLPPPLAHYNGTLQWHPAMAPRPLPQSWSSPSPLNHSTLQWHPTMAPSNGTTSTAPCNGTLVPRPIRQSGSSPSPPIRSKNPYSYRYLGNKNPYSYRYLGKNVVLMKPWESFSSMCPRPPALFGVSDSMW